MDRERIRNTGRRRTLEVFFNPKNVAVIGATVAPHSVGRSIVANLKDAPFPGAIYPVNPRHDTLLDCAVIAASRAFRRQWIWR